MPEMVPMRGRIVGRYALYNEIASGGMATVHFGRLLGPVGFSRTVAIKRLHPQYASDPEFVSMFLDEARLTARIRHPNVVPVIDVVALSGELLIVMEYVQGESLSRLVRALSGTGRRLPLGVAMTLATEMLYGLHAAHEAKSERGEPLDIVHRDVSPHNVMVGNDGIARVLDFGIAKAASRSQTTRDGQVKGKFAYMTPEQLTRGKVDRRADIFATSIVLWELVTGERLFAADDHGAIVARVLNDPIVPPSLMVTGLPQMLDAIVMKALARDPEQRFATAREMANALESVGGMARPNEIGEWVEAVAAGVLHQRAERLAEIEGMSTLPDAALPEPVASTDATQMLKEIEVSVDSRTDLSGAAPVPGKPWRQRGGAWVAGAVTVAAVVTGAMLLARGDHHDAGPTAAASAPSSSSVPTTGARPPPTALATALPPTTATVAAEPTPSAFQVTTASPAPPPAGGAVPASRPPRKPGKGEAPRSPGGKPGCTPPYYFDSDGTKQFRPECL